MWKTCFVVAVVPVSVAVSSFAGRSTGSGGVGAYLVTEFFFFVIVRRMGRHKALAHHTSTYFHTRRVSI